MLPFINIIYNYISKFEELMFDKVFVKATAFRILVSNSL